jgi:K(+)-stimulated pyrophosphate-energized sodium pump
MKSIKALLGTVALLVVTLFGLSAFAQGTPAAAHHGGGEDSLVVPNAIDTQQFFGMSASHLLQLGLVVSVLGVVFGLAIFFQLKNAPVHKSMKDVSELIYETCKT